MSARLLDIHCIRAFLERVTPLPPKARHEAVVSACLEGGGAFRLTPSGWAALTLYRIAATGPTEAAAIAAWIDRARDALADAEAGALPACP